jgi:hypothetical protein
LSSTSTVVYETPKGKRSIRDDEDEYENDDDDTVVKKDVEEYGREQFGKIAFSYLSPYVYGKTSLDTQCGIRKDNDGRFMIGDSALTVDSDTDIWIKGNRFKGTRGLWELFTRKNVKREIITSADLKAYKKILTMTNAHLEGYEPGSAIHIERGPKFRNIIASQFADAKKRGQESALARRWAKY